MKIISIGNYLSNINSNKVFKFLIISILALGIFFRFVHLDKKVFWYDETFTSLRVSGYTYVEAEAKLKQKTAANDVITVEDLQQYQTFQPENGLKGLLNGLIKEEAQLSPLYFMAVQSWVRLLGDSISVTRSVSAFASLLTLPAIYWLSQLLFNSPGVSWSAVALIAVSPFHVLYAQEARPSSWLTLFVLLSSATFLKAVQSGKKLNWAIYAVTLSLGYYTHLNIIILAAGHCIYILFNKKFWHKKILFSYFGASLVSLILFVPWLIALYINLSSAQKMTSWLSDDVSIKSLVKAWLLNINRLFIDFNYAFVYADLLSYLSITLTTLLVGYSIYFIIRSTQKQTWSFVIIIIAINVLPLLLPDLIFGGKRSAIARYLIIAYLGIQLAVAYLIARLIFNLHIKKSYQTFWRVVAGSLVSLSIISCLTLSQTDAWWNKLSSFDIPKVAAILNQTKNSLVICQGVIPFDLNHSLKSNIYFLYPNSKKQNNFTEYEFENQILDSYKNIFVFSHSVDSSSLLDYVIKVSSNLRIAKEYTWRRYHDPTFFSVIKLWQLERRNGTN
ncbi:glycosyltransferase family 39 protein [Nostoc sp. TCL26-01]|uniref:glycosyltransferase family 39 protein n=1 Tax=Nostoc sp. TCL26-01 TaxID=2576904 RepID=UPI0015BEED4F|nr:glycosyltransferase family 39 protein [Nostoc sp. TCL26-01]